MKKVIMTVQPNLLQSASKRRQTSAIVAPRVLTKKRKMITRKITKKIVPSSSTPSDINSNQVLYLLLKPLLYIHILWLTAIIFSG